MTERFGHWDLDAQTKPVILSCPGIERKRALEVFCLLCGDRICEGVARKGERRRAGAEDPVSPAI